MITVSRVLFVLCMVLLSGCALIAAQRNDARRLRDEALREVATLRSDIATLRANQASLLSDIDAQNLAVDRFRLEAEARGQIAATALARAQQDSRALAEQNRVLQGIVQTSRLATCDDTFDAARAAF